MGSVCKAIKSTDYGVLTNGYELILYKRIKLNHERVLRVNLEEVSTDDCKTICKHLRKPDYSLTQVKEILGYFEKFGAPESKIYLTTDAAREHFFGELQVGGGDYLWRITPENDQIVRLRVWQVKVPHERLRFLAVFLS